MRDTSGLLTAGTTQQVDEHSLRSAGRRLWLLAAAVVLVSLYVVVVGAQTGFVGGPRVMANMSLDQWLPRRFAALSERLTTQNGVLLIGAWELMHCQEIPYRVAINEAVELAKSFGGTDGHKYVNGVLDKAAADLRPAEVAAARAQRSAAQ